MMLISPKGHKFYCSLCFESSKVGRLLGEGKGIDGINLSGYH